MFKKYGDVERQNKKKSSFGRISISFKPIRLSFEQMKDLFGRISKSFEQISLSFEQITDPYGRISKLLEQIKKLFGRNNEL